MEDKYAKLFRNLETREASGLESKIIARLRAEEGRLARVKSFVFGTSSAASFGFSVWAVAYLAECIKTSGFGHYLSLALSGDGAIYSYWREIGLSLAESLPIVGFITVLAAIGFFIWSFTKITQQRYAFRF